MPDDTTLTADAADLDLHDIRRLQRAVAEFVCSRGAGAGQFPTLKTINSWLDIADQTTPTTRAGADHAK